MMIFPMIKSGSCLRFKGLRTRELKWILYKNAIRIEIYSNDILISTVTFVKKKGDYLKKAIKYIDAWFYYVKADLADLSLMDKYNIMISHLI